MRIAIVAPLPASPTVGGAELLVEGMRDAIRQVQGHSCELVRLQVKEDNFWDLIDAYHRFYLLDLSEFDLVVSTKYPSWMVRHRNHIVYMVHHLRGLFDTYPLFGEPYELPGHLRVGLVDEIMTLSGKQDPSEEDAELLFSRISSLKEEREQYDSETFRFPGPLIRGIIHFFDRFALSGSRVRGWYAMSENVRRREGYFPPDARVKVIHPPSTLGSLLPGEYRTLFTVSRLDGPKRIDLLIGAMKYVPCDIRLKIAGTGPELGRLEKIAGRDPRIEFLGHVEPELLSALYSEALVVLFVPYDEDYGLVTIEGMMSRKPVITALDSGGPLEFVKDNETGYVVKPDPEAIAARINHLIEHPGEARRMGEAGFRRVSPITWKHFVDTLLEGALGGEGRRKVLVLSTYSCYPARGGGQHRLSHLFSELAGEFDVTICSIIECNKEHTSLILRNGLRQLCIPQGGRHARDQWARERALGTNLYDVCMIDLLRESDEYVRKAKSLIEESDVIVFSHPYLFDLHRYVRPSQCTVYEAVDSEYLLKKEYIRDEAILAKVFSMEEQACRRSDLVWATSGEDRENLARLYQIPPEKIEVVPNGVDPSRICFIDPETREASKMHAGLGDRPTILFVGSWHPPNLEALDFIVEALAKRCREWIFLVLGSVREYYLKEKGKLPKNVLAFGSVDELEKYEIYKLADVAINPMFGGSGTNLKMIDYMSAGIPVVTTRVGARGLGLQDRVDAIISDPGHFCRDIRALLADPGMQEIIRKNARRKVEEEFSWDMIARAAAATIRATRNDP